MAMHECEAYWQDFLRRPKEQRAQREEQKQLQKEAADRMAALRDAKVKEVEAALAGCTPDQQQLLRPIFGASGLLELLHDCLLRSGRDLNVFSRRIESEQPLASRILQKAAEYERDPEACTWSCILGVRRKYRHLSHNEALLLPVALAGPLPSLCYSVVKKDDDDSS